MKPDPHIIENDLDFEEMLVLGALMSTTAEGSIDESVGSLSAEHFVSPLRRELASRIFALRLTSSEGHASADMVCESTKDEPELWGVTLGAMEALLLAIEERIAAASRALLDRGPVPESLGGLEEADAP